MYNHLARVVEVIWPLNTSVLAVGMVNNVSIIPTIAMEDKPLIRLLPILYICVLNTINLGPIIACHLSVSNQRGTRNAILNC